MLIFLEKNDNLIHVYFHTFTFSLILSFIFFRTKCRSLFLKDSFIFMHSFQIVLPHAFDNVTYYLPDNNTIRSIPSKREWIEMN